MWRAIRFIIIAAVFLAIAWAIGTIPGTFTAHSGPYTVQTRIPVAIVILVLIALIFVILVRVLGGIWRAPRGVGAWRGGRRQKLGEISTQRGLVALAAGDAKAAAAESARARKLLGDTPLVLLLAAESARLAGDQPKAEAAFRQLTADKTMAFIGHLGLVRTSIASGDHEAADDHALNAESAYPGSAWLKSKRLDIAVKKANWRAALGLTREKSEIAAIATAGANAAGNTREAFGYAKQAIKADPALAPAAVAYATVLRKAKRFRAAKRALLKTWARAPHPLIAAAYLENISAPIERVQAAADLAKAKPGHPETELLLAETSLAAKLTGEARRHAQAAIDAGMTDKRPYAVLGALDDGREALAKMAMAPSPAWACMACGAEQPDWHAACPACNKPGTLVWKSAAGRALAVV
jgi:HemY protein